MCFSYLVTACIARGCPALQSSYLMIFDPDILLLAEYWSNFKDLRVIFHIFIFCYFTFFVITAYVFGITFVISLIKALRFLLFPVILL